MSFKTGFGEIAEAQGYSVDFLDDNSPLAVGKIDELEEIEKDYDGSIVAIGNPEIKEKIFRRLKKPVSVIYPSSVVSKSAEIGAGCVIEANAVINSEAIVKDGVFICAGAVVNHNAMLEILPKWTATLWSLWAPKFRKR